MNNKLLLASLLAAGLSCFAASQVAASEMGEGYDEDELSYARERRAVAMYDEDEDEELGYQRNQVASYDEDEDEELGYQRNQAAGYDEDEDEELG